QNLLVYFCQILRVQSCYLQSSVNRTNIGGGWYMIDNILLKLDYVVQNYDGPAHGNIDGGKFDGVVFEAAISF
ncbi:MAG: hypothetical protein PHN94_12845, partial [Bacteroidales bacterium]|nr:hypothetical protein [Bacteroidales bacterium]